MPGEWKGMWEGGSDAKGMLEGESDANGRGKRIRGQRWEELGSNSMGWKDGGVGSDARK